MMTNNMSGISVFLADKGIYFLTAFLLVLGIYGMITCKNYMKKLICMNIMQVAVIFFFLCFGQKNGGTIPVQVTGLMGARHYINPLPHGLMLTAIVVSLGTTGVGLALLTRIKEKYGSIEEDDIIKGENKF
ncbi:sodium:proton antiporter [Mobilibacterium timonense]|uniref:sodium:proton antiporter n=1 Tax=Mobilibacterium timonense TaxID=1871012 RepID=UPI001F2B30A3|nr:cation:proton antiporter subunit C [Mobilibacterium timonense]